MGHGCSVKTVQLLPVEKCSRSDNCIVHGSKEAVLDLVDQIYYAKTTICCWVAILFTVVEIVYGYVLLQTHWGYSSLPCDELQQLL